MTEDHAKELELARKGRLVGIVIAVTMVLWMALQFAGGQIGLPQRYVFLFDFAAIAAFVWALVVVAQIWRARRDDKG